MSSTLFVQQFRIACALATVLFALCNLIMFAVIRRDQTLHNSASFRLLGYLACSYATICLLNMPGKLLSYYGCIIADHHIEQLLFDSQPYLCNLFGSLTLACSVATAMAHFVLALNRFCTIFAKKLYISVFSRRKFQLVMWMVLVICLPLGLVSVRAVDSVSNFISYDGYCVCVPAFRRDEQQWGVQSVSNIGLMVTIVLTCTIYAVIGVRSVFGRRQQSDRAHTRGTFVNFFVYIVCIGQASFLNFNKSYLQHKLLLWGTEHIIHRKV